MCIPNYLHVCLAVFLGVKYGFLNSSKKGPKIAIYKAVENLLILTYLFAHTHVPICSYSRTHLLILTYLFAYANAQFAYANAHKQFAYANAQFAYAQKRTRSTSGGVHPRAFRLLKNRVF